MGNTVTSRPLVSFITGTFERPDMLAELIDNIREQTYRPLEHCIVADGPDEELAEVIRASDARHHAECFDAYGGNEDRYVPIKFVEAGRHWSKFLANSISAVPFQMAQWLSSGEYLCWAADDERFTPDHVEKLVALAEQEQADFVYPLQGCYWAGSITRHMNWIGSPTPVYGQITHALFRAELLDYRGFEINVGSGTDWDQVKTWMRSGARWAFLPEKTMTHRVDKAGDGDARQVRQPLRGHTAFGSHAARSANPVADTDCYLCNGDTLRACWCHSSQGGNDNRPCRCTRIGATP